MKAFDLNLIEYRNGNEGAKLIILYGLIGGLRFEDAGNTLDTIAPLRL